MKCTLLVFFLFFVFQTVVQDLDLQHEIEFVNLTIEQTEKGERLNGLDSLTKLTYRNPK